MTRYSVLASKLGDLVSGLREVLKHAGPDEKLYNHDFTVLAWDPDAGDYQPVSGYIYDPANRTLTLQTDDTE
jgi:hypothetical protein